MPRLNTKYKDQWAADLSQAINQDNSEIKAEKVPEVPQKELTANLDKGIER